MHTNSPPGPLPEFPLKAADLCVKCGLCLPHCPTYGEQQHEGDSPRGRITLMQGLASGLIGHSAALEQHLDGCLGCRACESVCPAKVPYGELIDAGRTLLAQRQPSRTRLTRLMGGLLSRRGWRRALRRALWLYQRSGIQGLLRRTQGLGHGRMARLESLLPARIALPEIRTAGAQVDAEVVQLFSGCVSDIADQAALNATRLLLARIGLQVEEPTAQTCCGALYQHDGLPQKARQLSARNVQAFAGEVPIVFAASGCGASLRDYARLHPAANGSGRDFVGRLQDIHQLLQRQWPTTLQLQPLAAKVLVHLPCTQRNVVGGSEHILALLRRIPQLRVEVMPDATGCCGAAGSYFLTQPQMADQLLRTKLDAASEQAPDFIVSSNIGCALHLAGGLRRRGLRVPVLHPVQLLAQQLPAAATAPPGATSTIPPVPPG
jgi:glycolate oxidase iron-sulfur subunit